MLSNNRKIARTVDRTSADPVSRDQIQIPPSCSSKVLVATKTLLQDHGLVLVVTLLESL